MDKLQWFKFTPSDWMMGKIQRCPEITQARFMRLCCLYWNKEANLLRDDAIIEIDQEHYDILISKKIIQDDGAHVFIQFLDEQLEDITLTSKSKSRAAKIRWERYNAKQVQSTSNADAMHVHTDAMQNDAEKRREEERDKREREREKERELTTEGEPSTFKNLNDRKIEFGTLVKDFVGTYSDDMCKRFFNYWTESNVNGKKMRFEMEKVFDLKRRLATWAKNDKEWNKDKEPIKDKLVENVHKAAGI